MKLFREGKHRPRIDLAMTLPRKKDVFLPSFYPFAAT